MLRSCLMTLAMLAVSSSAFALSHTKDCQSQDGLLAYHWAQPESGIVIPGKIPTTERVTFQGKEIPISLLEFVTDSYQIVSSQMGNASETIHYQITARLNFEPPYEAELTCVELQHFVP